LVFGESLEDCVRGYGLGVIEVVACCKFCVGVVSFNRVKVGSFSLVLYYLHNLFRGAKWVGFFVKVFGKAGFVIVVAKVGHVFFIAGGKLSPSLSNICLVAFGAVKFVYSRAGVCITVLVILRE